MSDNPFTCETCQDHYDDSDDQCDICGQCAGCCLCHLGVDASEDEMDWTNYAENDKWM